MRNPQPAAHHRPHVLLRSVIWGLWTGCSFLFATVPAAWATDVCGPIVSNTTWALAGSPFIATCTVTVSNNAILTVEPGVEVKFNANTGLVLGSGSAGSAGILNAQGAAAQPITFTANTPTPTPGFWNGLDFQGTTSASILEYATVEYGGADANNANIRVGFSTPTITPTIQNSTIRLSDGYGVFVTSAGKPSLMGNVFDQNGSYPLHVEITNFPTMLSGNTYTANGIQAIELVGGAVTTDLTLVNDGLPYAATSTIFIHGGAVNADTVYTLTIEAGTRLEFAADAELRLGWVSNFSGASYPAALTAVGTAAAPIILTGATPTPGFWRGVNLDNVKSPTTLDHVVIEYGGGGLNNANVSVANASRPAVAHTAIRQSDGYGIVAVSSAVPTITHSNITDNLLDGLNSAVPILGRLNWWGDLSGPSGAGPGTGDGVSSTVAFEPWLGAPFTTPFGWIDAQESSDAFSQSGGATTLGATFSESANWNLMITDATSTVVKMFGGTAPQVAQDWLGDDTAGVALPNGTYTYHWSAISVGTGQTIAPALGRVTLNNALPIAHIESPDPFAMLPAQSMLSVVGSAGGATFSSYTLEYGEGALPATWTTIASQTTPVASGQLGIWNTTGLAQPVYTLKLRVVSTGGGSTATDTVTVRLLDLANLNDAPDPFSPNGDGLNETTTMSVIATYPVNWVLTITNSIGGTTKVFTGTGQAIAQAWNGTDTLGALAPDGVYTYQFQGTEAASGVMVSSAVGQVTLRHISINNVFVSPSIIDPYAGQQAGISYTLVHGLNTPMDVTIRLYDEPSHQLTRTLVALAQLPGPHTVMWDGRDAGGAVATLEAYYFTIQAVDALGATANYNDAVTPIPGSTVPTVSSSMPSLLPFDPYRNDIVPFQYELDAAGRLTIRISSVPNNATIHTLLNGGVRTSGSHLEVWDGRLSTGEFYTGVFNIFVDPTQALSENAILVVHPLPAITDFRAEAYLIQPVHREASLLTYTLAQNTTMTITITDPNGSAVRTLLSGVAQPMGPQTIEWDGRTDTGETVSVEGIYTVTLTGVDPVSGLSAARVGVITVYK